MPTVKIRHRLLLADKLIFYLLMILLDTPVGIWRHSWYEEHVGVCVRQRLRSKRAVSKVLYVYTFLGTLVPCLQKKN